MEQRAAEHHDGGDGDGDGDGERIDVWTVIVLPFLSLYFFLFAFFLYYTINTCVALRYVSVLSIIEDIFLLWVNFRTFVLIKFFLRCDLYLGWFT